MRDDGEGFSLEQVASLLHDVIGLGDCDAILAIKGTERLLSLLRKGSESYPNGKEKENGAPSRRCRWLPGELEEECREQGAAHVIMTNLDRWPGDEGLHICSLEVLKRIDAHLPSRRSKSVLGIMRRYRDKPLIIKPLLPLLSSILHRGTAEKLSVISADGITLLTGLVARYSMADSEMASDLLKCMALLASEPSKGRQLVQNQSMVMWALRAMDKYPRVNSVQVAAIDLLARLSEDKEAVKELVEAEGAARVYNALRLLVSDQKLQDDGLRMMQLVARDPDGYEQLGKISGAWLLLCQGSTMYSVQSTRGWTISEEEGLEPGEYTRVTIWTPRKLYEFMGRGREHDSNASGPESQAYFQCVVEAELLPREGENKYDWLARAREFEAMVGVNLKELASQRLEGG